MVRECAASLLLVPAAGCSVILDFSDHAIPGDAAPFSAAECAYQEPNDSVDKAALITTGDTGPAAICTSSDHDFYRFTVPAMTRVEIRVDYAYRATGDLDLRLYATSGGMELARSNNFSDEELITCPGSAPPCPTLAPGDYVFEVFAGSAGSVNRYTFSLALSAL
jgi:hypothetical protein